MRICRFNVDDRTLVGFYTEDRVIPFEALGIVSEAAEQPNSLLDYLPLGPKHAAAVQASRILQQQADAGQALGLPLSEVQLLVPIPNPGKLLLLAGNYARHIEEGGGRAEERAKTFPYVFMKPPATTLTHPGDPVRIPPVSPDQIDWELELGVIIGRTCQAVSEADALSHVAGYTVVNDISDRAFHPNPGRNGRPKDQFFDWLHGKWHDTFCPMGPCVVSADAVADPQSLQLTLKVNGQVEQDGSTGEMVFPVAAIIEFLSSFVTLHPGDIISTGTPDGVGKAKGKFLRSGDLLEAEIEGIGVLRNPVV